MGTMLIDRDPTFATDRISLYDLGYEVVEQLSQDGQIMDLLKICNDGQVAEGIGMFLDLSEPTGMWVVTDEETARNEWTFELPVAIAEEVKRFVINIKIRDPEGNPYDL